MGSVGVVVGIGDIGHLVAGAFAALVRVPAALRAGGELLRVGVGGFGGGLWRAIGRSWGWAGASVSGGRDGGQGEEGEQCFHGDVFWRIVLCLGFTHQRVHRGPSSGTEV